MKLSALRHLIMTLAGTVVDLEVEEASLVVPKLRKLGFDVETERLGEYKYRLFLKEDYRNGPDHPQNFSQAEWDRNELLMATDPDPEGR